MFKYIWIVLTACAFGTMEIALHIGGLEFSPLQLTFLRFLIGGLVLLPFALHSLFKRRQHLQRRDFLTLALLGFINVVVSMTLFQLSVNHCNANLAAVLVSVNPLFTMILAHFIIHDHFTVKKGIVLAICMIGMCLVANPVHLAAGNEPIGILFGLGASISFGLYTVLSHNIVKRAGGMTVNSFSFLFGAFFEFLILAALGEPIVGGINGETIGIVLYTGVVVTGFGYLCFMRAIELTGASHASYAFFIKPIIAMFLAAAILKEPITWNIALGIGIIVAGFLFNAFYKSPRPIAAAPAKTLAAGPAKP